MIRGTPNQQLNLKRVQRPLRGWIPAGESSITVEIAKEHWPDSQSAEDYLNRFVSEATELFSAMEPLSGPLPTLRVSSNAFSWISDRKASEQNNPTLIMVLSQARKNIA